MYVSIKNLNKAKVLMALYNSSRMQGLSFLGGDGSPMNEEEADNLLNRDSYFDYLNGKVMKVDLGGDVVNLWLYDRDNGNGAGLRAIKSIYPDVKELTDEEIKNLK